MKIENTFKKILKVEEQMIIRFPLHIAKQIRTMLQNKESPNDIELELEGTFFCLVLKKFHESFNRWKKLYF